MLQFTSEKSNFSPFKKAADPRVDCRSLFSTGHLTPALSPTKDALSRRDQLLESAQESTRDIMLHGAPLPLIWVLVLDNVIPEYAVPLSEAYGGPQFIARAFLEGQYCIGKAGTGLPFGALITYASRQLTVKRYEVLCFATEMRWNIAQERQGYQQSSFIASSPAKFSRNSFCTSRSEITSSMLMESDVMRVIPYEMDGSRDYLMHKRQCSSPLSPISRHVIEEICSSAALETQTTGVATRLAQSPSLSALSIHHEDEIEPCHSEFAYQAQSTHLCSRTCGCESRGLGRSQAPNSQTKRPSRLFTEIGQSFQKLRKLSATPQPHRGPDLTNNEHGSATSEQSHIPRRTRSLSGVLSTRLPNTLRTEIERRNNQGPHDVPISTSPRVLSPIAHFSVPEPFDNSAGSFPAVRSPQGQTRSIAHVLSQNYQDEAPSGRVVHTKPSGVVRMSSPLAGRHQLPAFSSSSPGHHRSLLHDTDDGSDTEAESFYRSANPARGSDSANSAWVGASAHERKPHIRPMQPLSPRLSASLRPIGKSLAGLKAIDNCEATSVTSTINRDRPHAQDRGTTLKPDLRRLISSEPSAGSSARSTYHLKGDKAGQHRSSASVTVPLIIVSPSANTRELPEAPSYLRSLDVSVDAHRSRYGSDASLSGGRETSAKTRTISSSHAAVTATVAASHTDDSPPISPSAPISDIHEHDGMATRDYYARSPTTTTTEQRLKGPYLSDVTPAGRAPFTTESWHEKPVFKTRESDAVREDYRVPEDHSRVRSSLPATQQLPGPKLPTTQYVSERDNVEERRGHTSVQDTFVHEVEITDVPSLHSDMVLSQPSKGNFDGAGVLLSSYSGGRPVGHYDSIRATDVTKGYPRADTMMMASNSLSSERVAQENPPLAQKPIPHGFGTLAQVEDTRLSVEASRKAAEINRSSEVASVYSPPGLHSSNGIKDTEYRPVKVKDEEYRDVGLSWNEKGQKYQVPLDEYLRHDEASPVISKERRDEEFSRGETRIRHHGSPSVMHETEEEVPATQKFTDNDVARAQQSSSKRGDSVVSTILATAGIAAVVFEAVSEARNKERSERAEAKLDNRSKVSSDYSPTLRAESPGVHEDDMALKRTVQRAVVDDSRISPKAATCMEAALEDRTETYCNSSVDVETRESVVDNTNNRLVVDIPENAYTKESTESTLVAKKAVSTEQTPSAETRTFEGAPPYQRKQTQVTSNGRPRPARTDNRRVAYADQSWKDAPREQKAEAVVENGANQYASVDIAGVVTRTSDQSPAMIEGQDKVILLGCENERISAEPRSNSAPQGSQQEHAIIMVSPQVCVNVQQTTAVTTTNNNTTNFAGPTPVDQQGRVAETAAVRPGTDTSAEDTRSGCTPRSMPGAREDIESPSLVEFLGYESRTVSESVVAAPLNPNSKPVAVDTRPLSQETTVVPGQGIPIPDAYREQPNIINDGTRLSTHVDVSEVMITGPCATSNGEDTVHQTNRVEHGMSQSQPSPRSLRNASPGTTLLSLEKDQSILSSKSSETFTETRPLESSDRNTVAGKQLGRVRNSGAVSVHDANGVQKSIPLARPGFIARGTVPRKSATFDFSKPRPMPEKTRSATIYNVAGVTRNRADLSRPSAVKKPLLETDGHANGIQRNTGPSVSEVQTISKESSVVHSDTRAQATEGGIAGMLSVQKSNEQAEYVHSKPDLRDMGDVEEDSLKIYTVSSECAKDSSRGSAYTVEESSDSMACRRDEKTSQYEAVQEIAKAEVTIQSSTFEEQGEVFIEPSKLSVDANNISPLDSILRPDHGQHFISASPHEDKSLLEGTDLLEAAEHPASLTRTPYGTVSVYDSNLGSYREYLGASVKDERTLDTDLSVIHLVSAHDDEKATPSDSHAIISRSTQARSLDSVDVDGTKENQDINESQVQRSSVLKSGSATIERTEEDVTQVDALLGVSNTTTETSLTTIVAPAATVVDRSYADSSALIVTESQTEASEYNVSTEDISREVVAPSGPPPPDNQTDIAQTMENGIASACAVVAIVAASELSKELVREHISSTTVIPQQNRSESGESTTGKRYDNEDHAAYTECETVSVVMDCSDQCTLAGEKIDAPTALTSLPRQSSIENRQVVCDVDLKSESTLCKSTALVTCQSSSYAEQTQTAEECSTTISEVAKGDTRKLHLDIGIHSTESVHISSISNSDSISSHIEDGHSRRSSILGRKHQSIGKGGSPSDQQISPDGSSPARSPHILHSRIFDSPTSSHGIIAKRDIEHELTFSSHTDSSSKVTTEINESETHVDIDSNVQVAEELSTVLITGGEVLGERMDQVVDNYSGEHFSRVASSGLAQEEQTQVVGMRTMDKDDEWEINTWVPSEPPPSYQDATSDYDAPHVQPNDVLPEGDSLGPYAEYRGETKLSIVDASIDGVQLRSEEGSSVLERRGAFRVTHRMNDENAEKSTFSEAAHGEATLGTRQETPAEGVRSPARSDRECVLDEFVGVESNERGTLTAREQFEVDTIQLSHSVAFSEDRTTSETRAFEVHDESRSQESMEHISTQDEACTAVFSAVSVQSRTSLSTVDEEEDAFHRDTQPLSPDVALQSEEEIWGNVSPVPPQHNDKLLDVLASGVVVSESCGGGVAEGECVAPEDTLYAVDELQINSLSSELTTETSSHHEIESETITLDEHTIESQETLQQSISLESIIQTEHVTSILDTPISVLGTTTALGEDHEETRTSFTDAHDTQVSFDRTTGYLVADIIDQRTRYVEEGEEEEEGSMDMSQEILSQHEEHAALTPSAFGSDHHLSESGECDEERHIRESPSRGSLVINTDTFIDERSKVGEIDLQEHTAQVAVTITTEKHDGADIETDRIRSGLTQSTISHEHKDIVEGVIDLTVSTAKTGTSVSQISTDLDLSRSHDQTEHVYLTEDEREQEKTSQTLSCERTGGMLDDSECKIRRASTLPSQDVGDSGKLDKIALRNEVEQEEAEVAGDVTDSKATQNTVLETALAAATWVLVASDATKRRNGTSPLDEEMHMVSVSVEDQPSLLPPLLTPKESPDPLPSLSQTLTDTHTTSEFHLSTETTKTSQAHEELKVTLVDEAQGQSSISSQSSVHKEIRNDSSVGEENGVDDSTVLTEAPTSRLTDELNHRSTQQPLVSSEASDKTESHFSHQQTSYICLDVGDGSLSADASLVVPEVHGSQVPSGNSSVADLGSTPSKDDSLAPAPPSISVTPAIQITTSGHISGTQQLHEAEQQENGILSQITSRPSIAFGSSFTAQSTNAGSRAVLPESTTEDMLRVEETFDITNVIDASKEWTGTVTHVHSHDDTSLQETVNGELWMNETWTTRPSRPAIRPMLNRTPSFDYLEEFKKEWIGVDLYDIAEQGVLHRSLSRPLPPMTQYARYESEEVIQSSDEQALVVGSQSELSLNWELAMETHESVLALSKTMGASRHESIIRGWGEFGFARYVSVRGGMRHGLVDEDIHPGTIVRTTEHSTQTPIVIVAARANGQLFDEDKLAEHVLSCVNLDLLDVQQELCLLCLVGEKSIEVMGALAETMYAVQDVLLYEGIEIGSASVEEVEMGYWVKVVLWRAQWTETGGMHLIENGLDASGSVVVRRRRVPSIRGHNGAIRETVLTLSKAATMPRHSFVVWGWGKLGFARYVSPQVQQGPLYDDLEPGTIIRTTDRMHGPTVVVVARANGQPFDEEELAKHVHSCINPGSLDTPQELSLLYLVGSKTSEVTDAMTETLYVIQDVLLYEGIEIGSASVEEVEMGYSVKAVLTRAQWIEEGEAHIDEGEDEGIEVDPELDD